MPPPVISEVYAGFHVICWLHFVREGGKGEGKEGKGKKRVHSERGRKGYVKVMGMVEGKKM